MPTNSRFYIAAHILVLLAMYPEERLTSAAIAKSVGTNPVVIRRLLSRLGKAGLLRARTGAGGGSVMARPADRITLAAVYRAVEDEAVLSPGCQTPSACCPVGRNIHGVLGTVAGSVETAIDGALSEVTIADAVKRIRRLSKAG
jgi:Rrf2 family protein